jgi:WhiB family redox-sensing transcriptional regulator
MAVLELFVDQIQGEVDWRHQAACRGRTALFFPRRAERPQARHRREAKAATLCSGCPVQQDCQSFARANHEYGYWGGESEEARHLAGFTLAAPIGIAGRGTEPVCADPSTGKSIVEIFTTTH